MAAVALSFPRRQTDKTPKTEDKKLMKRKSVLSMSKASCAGVHLCLSAAHVTRLHQAGGLNLNLNDGAMTATSPPNNTPSGDY